jgi:large subunit ribosomal protein L29
MKLKDLKEMPAEERNNVLRNLREELLKERSSVAMGGSAANPGRIKAIRKEIARIRTLEGIEKE